MRSFFQWDIWYVEWMHEDGTSKARPALLISPTAHNSGHDELWFVKISGQRHSVPYFIELSPDDPAFAGTGLKKKSYIYVADIQQIPKARVLNCRGRLNMFTALLVDMQIRKATGWSPPS